MHIITSKKGKTQHSWSNEKSLNKMGDLNKNMWVTILNEYQLSIPFIKQGSQIGLKKPSII